MAERASRRRAGAARRRDARHPGAASTPAGRSYLDAAPPRSAIASLRRFPNIVEGCAAARASTCAADPVPVAPAAHYLMGGIATDLDGGDLDRRPLRRRARAPAPACTAPTGWRRTRCSSASSSRTAPSPPAWTPRRAIVADAGPPPDRPLARAPLAELRRGCGTAPGPCATGRGSSGSPRGSTTGRESNPVLRRNPDRGRPRSSGAESRGSHLRRDYPDPDPALERGRAVHSDFTRRRDRPRAGGGSRRAATSTTDGRRCPTDLEVTADVVVKARRGHLRDWASSSRACGGSTRTPRWRCSSAEGELIACAAAAPSRGSTGRPTPS